MLFLHREFGKEENRCGAVAGESRIGAVIACDKRKAFAQRSESDEAIQSLADKDSGLLRYRSQ
jgi:hypothetical protein